MFQCVSCNHVSGVAVAACLLAAVLFCRLACKHDAPSTCFNRPHHQKSPSTKTTIQSGSKTDLGLEALRSHVQPQASSMSLPTTVIATSRFRRGPPRHRLPVEDVDAILERVLEVSRGRGFIMLGRGTKWVLRVGVL